MSHFHLPSAQFTTYLEQCGFFGERSSEMTSINADFMRQAGVTGMSYDAFLMDCTSRGFSSEQVSAFFEVFGPDRNGLISVQGYALFRAALVNFDYVRDAGSTLVNFRLKCLFVMFDKNRNGFLEMKELRSMISRLAAGDTHVDYLIRSMGIKTDDGAAICSLDAFMSPACRQAFSKHALSSRDPLKPLVFGRTSSGGGAGAGAGAGAGPKGEAAPAERGDTATADDNGDDKRSRECRVVLSRTAVAAQSHRGSELRQASAAVATPAYNVGCVIIPEMVAECDWRGLAVDRSSTAFKIATRIVECARCMSLMTMQEEEVRDSEWMLHGRALKTLLGNPSDKMASIAELNALFKECKRILRAQPVCVEVSKPAKVFGDVHGQFRDLLLLFREFGFPSNRCGDVDSVSYVFNGDWVDRGAHQVETVVLLFALKVSFPSRIHLIRGNHEFVDVDVSASTGFRSACSNRFGSPEGPQIFNAIHDVFSWLPLSAVIDHKALVLHGGIGAGTWGLEQLRAIHRPLADMYDVSLKKSERELITDILWSDPMGGDETMSRGVHGNPRGEEVRSFSSDVTERFCLRNDISLVIRSHQFVPEGYRIMHNGRLITIFSARNYFQRESNDGALLLLADDESGNLQVRAKKIRHVPWK